MANINFFNEEECRDIVQQITEYIATVNDNLMKIILYKRHIELKSWVQISAEMGNGTPDSVRMAHKRFLQKNHAPDVLFAFSSSGKRKSF